MVTVREELLTIVTAREGGNELSVTRPDPCGPLCVMPGSPPLGNDKAFPGCLHAWFANAISARPEKIVRNHDR